MSRAAHRLPHSTLGARLAKGSVAALVALAAAVAVPQASAPPSVAEQSGAELVAADAATSQQAPAQTSAPGATPPSGASSGSPSGQAAQALPSGPTAGKPTTPGAAAPSAASPTAPTGETAQPPAPSDEVLAELAVQMGKGGAAMGQGLKRIEAGKSPTSSLAQTAQTALDPETLPEPASTAGDPGAVQTKSNAVVPLTSPSTASTAVTAEVNTWRPPGIQGMDVSGWQSAASGGRDVDWQQQWDLGSRFAYVKATEGTTYVSDAFSAQYLGSHDVGMVRGAYHFALPSVSTGATQANFFVRNGGGWTADGATLPPLLDIEYNPYSSLGNVCYNMSPAQMVAWIKDFSATMLSLVGRVPAIYTTTDWWSRCTGNSAEFSDHPLHIAAYNTVGAGTLPAGWDFYSFWQYSSQGPFDGDSNQWNGSYNALKMFARGDSSAKDAPVKSAGDLLVLDAAGNLLAHPADGRGGVSAIATRLASGWSGVKAVYVVDWNNDGILDLLAQWSDGSLQMSPGTDGAGFGPPLVVGVGWQDISITVGWWNAKDPYPSVLAKDATGRLLYYPNTSGKYLGSGQQIGSGFAGHRVAMVDFDGDGTQDLLSRTADGTMYHYAGNGQGGFTTGTGRAIGQGWQGMTAVASSWGFMGSSSLGLVAKDSAGDVHYYPIANGAWGTPWKIGAGWSRATLGGAPADPAPLAEIGPADVVGALGSGVLNRYAAPGNGTLAAPMAIGSGWSTVRQAFVVDWNADAVHDLLAVWPDGRITAYFGRAGGGFGGAVVVGTGWTGWEFTVGRWKTSEHLPSIVGRAPDGTLNYIANLAGTSLAAPTVIGWGWDGLSLTQIDFDRDGRQDIVARTAGGDMRLYRSDGAGVFLDEPRKTVGTGWQIMDAVLGSSGFTGGNSRGLLARITDGTLRYYPIGAGGVWGTPSVIGSGWGGINLFAPSPQ